MKVPKKRAKGSSFVSPFKYRINEIRLVSQNYTSKRFVNDISEYESVHLDRRYAIAMTDPVKPGESLLVVGIRFYAYTYNRELIDLKSGEYSDLDRLFQIDPDNIDDGLNQLYRSEHIAFLKLEKEDIEAMRELLNRYYEDEKKGHDAKIIEFVDFVYTNSLLPVIEDKMKMCFALSPYVSFMHDNDNECEVSN